MTEMRFRVSPTGIPGVTVVTRLPIGDARGWLERMYCADEMQPLLGSAPIRQVNRTMTSARGTVRGLHYQRAPHAEAKLVSCLRGRIFDVAVDLRRGSPTFLRWHGEELSGDNAKSMLIPPGCAHGFQALEPGCELLYFHTASYSPAHEGGINAADGMIGVAWPLEIGERSARDRGLPQVADGFEALDP